MYLIFCSYKHYCPTKFHQKLVWGLSSNFNLNIVLISRDSKSIKSRLNSSTSLIIHVNSKSDFLNFVWNLM